MILTSFILSVLLREREGWKRVAREESDKEDGKNLFHFVVRIYACTFNILFLLFSLPPSVASPRNTLRHPPCRMPALASEEFDDVQFERRESWPWGFGKKKYSGGQELTGGWLLLRNLYDALFWSAPHPENYPPFHLERGNVLILAVI